MYAPVYIMRHGCTVLDNVSRSDGWLDLPLSDPGRVGLMGAQQHLKMIPLKAIHTADLKRTHETGHIISSGSLYEPPVNTSKRGNTWDLGYITGMKKYYGHPHVAKLIENPRERPLGGESYDEFKARFIPWFKRHVLDTGTPARPVLYIGSGSNLRCIGKELLGDADAIDLDEGCLVALRKDGRKWHAEIILGGELDDTIRNALMS